MLKDDGAFQFGKNILEILNQRFGKNFRLILTKDTDSIEKTGNAHPRVKLSLKLLNRMNSEKFERTRDVKNEIIRRKFFIAFPDYFKEAPPAPYAAGQLARIISPGVSKKMSASDKEALNRFLPEYLAAEAMSTVALKASTQIQSLKQLANELGKELARLCAYCLLLAAGGGGIAGISAPPSKVNVNSRLSGAARAKIDTYCLPSNM